MLFGSTSEYEHHVPVTYRFGSVDIDFASGIVRREGTPVSLSLKQLQLLRYLISWRGSILTRNELLSAVWGYKATKTRTLDVHIALLRQKLEETPHHPKHIRTVRGKGYTFFIEDQREAA